jgi:predicted RNase H-like HicB family nuclease
MGFGMRDYTFSVKWSEEDQEHVGLCAEFPSLAWLEKTPEGALAGIRKIVAETVAELIEDSESFPEPLTIITKSGERLILPTEDEEAAINAGIAADPDNPEWTKDEIRRARPFREWAKERGIPLPTVITKVTPMPGEPQKD